MAKKTQAGLKELPAEPVETIEGFAVSETGEPAFESPEGPFRWRVSLNCPTPLAHKTLEVEAATEQEAREKFCQANGISDSRHDWSIVRVG